MPNLTCETADDTLAINWAMELSAAFARDLGHECPLAIEATATASGEPAVELLGIVIGLADRDTPSGIAHRVASELAGFVWPYQSRWYENAREVAGFIRHRYDELSSDRFEDWLEEFGSEPWKWDVDYLAYRSHVG